MKNEEGTVATPFDMDMMNDLDRFYLVMDVIDRVPKLSIIGAPVKQAMLARLRNHKEYISIYGDDMPEIRNWKWPKT